MALARRRLCGSATADARQATPSARPCQGGERAKRPRLLRVLHAPPLGITGGPRACPRLTYAPSAAAHTWPRAGPPAGGAGGYAPELAAHKCFEFPIRPDM